MCRGDFNAVRAPEERLGASSFSRQMLQFSEWIEESELVDLPLCEALYTWSNNQDKRVYSRLDQFLFTEDWLDMSEVVIQEVLPKMTSEHNPIILRQDSNLSLPCPFRFELMWLEIPGFIDRIKSWWVEIQVEGMLALSLPIN